MQLEGMRKESGVQVRARPRCGMSEKGGDEKGLNYNKAFSAHSHYGLPDAVSVYR